MKKICSIIKDLIPNAEVLFNVNLKKYHTYHIECYAQTLINISASKDLKVLLKFLKDNEIQYFILGNGSNVLFKNKKIKKLIIRLCGNEITLLKNDCVKCFAGVNLNSLLAFCLKHELGGLEWCARIPASVGGGIVMNLGSFNHAISEYLKEITYFNGKEIVTMKPQKADFSYRNSIFKTQQFVIISAVFKLQKSQEIEIKNKIKNFINLKSLTQPIFEYSCGSVFKNGENYYVAKLIQDCNLKGFRVGGAEISKLHSNFIINKNNATSNDVLKVIKYVKKVIQKQYNICILLEVVVE